MYNSSIFAHVIGRWGVLHLDSLTVLKWNWIKCVSHCCFRALSSTVCLPAVVLRCPGLVARARGVKTNGNWLRRVTVRVLCSVGILQCVISLHATTSAERSCVFSCLPLSLFFLAFVLLFFEFRSFCLEQVELISLAIYWSSPSSSGI